MYDTLSNEEIKSCIDLCLQKEHITKDIHTQAGLSIDLILKTSLKRQSMDNITCVMLTFEGFEALFSQIKETISRTGEDKQITLSSSQNFINMDSKQEPTNSRKIKTANGMIKKPLSLAKNLSTSIVSNDIKDQGTSSQVQNVCGTTTHKNSLIIASRIMDGMKSGSSQSKYEENQATTVIKSKLKEDLSLPVSSIPSTAKNSKSKPVIFPK